MSLIKRRLSTMRSVVNELSANRNGAITVNIGGEHIIYCDRVMYYIHHMVTNHNV